MFPKVPLGSTRLILHLEGTLTFTELKLASCFFPLTRMSLKAEKQEIHTLKEGSDEGIARGSPLAKHGISLKFIILF